MIQRTRQYVRNGYQNLERWINQHSDQFSVIPPEAAAIAFVRYQKDVNSTKLVERLVQDQDTYIVPGDHFGLDHHLRISYGLAEDYVNEGLRRVYETYESL